MAEWAFNIATNEYPCPKCGAGRGKSCSTPKGRKSRTPHGERISLLRPSDWDRCKGTAMSASEALNIA